MKTNYLALAVAILATITAFGQQKKPAPTPKLKSIVQADGSTTYHMVCPKGWVAYISQEDKDEYNNGARTYVDAAVMFSKVVCVVEKKGDPK